MAGTPLEALSALAESLDLPATSAQLERVLPILTRTLRNELRGDTLPDLGETEPAYGLRFDVGQLRRKGDIDGSS